jgi:hypothetical protein
MVTPQVDCRGARRETPEKTQVRPLQGVRATRLRVLAADEIRLCAAAAKARNRKSAAAKGLRRNAAHMCHE